MATPMHSPRARGYDTWLGYWHHANDYFTLDQDACAGRAVRDLWRQNTTFDGPATDLANGPACSERNQTPGDGSRCVFEDSLLTAEVLRILRAHATAAAAAAAPPFFVFWAPHLVHMPLQVPTAYLAQFPYILNPQRRRMHAMVKLLDAEIQSAVTELKRSGAWNRTLVVIHADNVRACVWLHLWRPCRYTLTAASWRGVGPQGGEIMGAGVCGGTSSACVDPRRIFSESCGAW
jgi:arylsulfatase B